MPDLTDAARRNLASGATSGPGTHVCAACGGPKEPSRINSRQCRDCARPDSTAPTQTDLLARIAALEERVTALEAMGASPSTDMGADALGLRAVPDPPTDEQWAALREWSAEHPDEAEVLRNLPRGRAIRYHYAIDHLGYRPR